MNNTAEIREANLRDLPSIVEIYNQAIKSGSATADLKEFSLEQRIEWFNKFDSNQFPIYVTELDKEVIAYATLSPYRPGRDALNKVAEISFYIDYEHHGKGIGSALVRHAISNCKRIGKKSLMAILLDTNTSSISLLEKFNFEKWGHFPNIVDLNGLHCGQLIYGLNIN